MRSERKWEGGADNIRSQGPSKEAAFVLSEMGARRGLEHRRHGILHLAYTLIPELLAIIIIPSYLTMY